MEDKIDKKKKMKMTKNIQMTIIVQYKVVIVKEIIKHQAQVHMRAVRPMMMNLK
jgi:hypothetical protein